MAFKKDLQKNGYIFNYWMLGNISASKINVSTNITIRLYKDRAQRLEDIHSYIDSVDIQIPKYNISTTEIYDLLKEQNTHIDVLILDEVNSTKDNLVYIKVPFFKDAEKI